MGKPGPDIQRNQEGQKVNLKKLVIIGALMSIGLAIYRLYVEEPYFKALEEQGKPVGVGEVALGFFGAWIIMTLIGWWVTRNLGKQEA